LLTKSSTLPFCVRILAMSAALIAGIPVPNVRAKI